MHAHKSELQPNSIDALCCATTSVFWFTRSQISKVQLNSPAGRSSRGQVRTATAAEQPALGDSTYLVRWFLRRPPTPYPQCGGCVRSRRSFHRGPLIINVVQLDSMIRRPCARFGGPLPYPMGPLGPPSTVTLGRLPASPSGLGFKRMQGMQFRLAWNSLNTSDRIRAASRRSIHARRSPARLPLHTSPFILSTQFSVRRLQPLSLHSFTSATSNTPRFLMCSVSPLFIHRPPAPGRSTCRRSHAPPSSSTGLAKCRQIHLTREFFSNTFTPCAITTLWRIHFICMSSMMSHV